MVSLQFPFISVTLLWHSRIISALFGSDLLCWTGHQNPCDLFHAMVLSYNPSCCKWDFFSGFLHIHLKLAVAAVHLELCDQSKS